MLFQYFHKFLLLKCLTKKSIKFVKRYHNNWNILLIEKFPFLHSIFNELLTDFSTNLMNGQCLNGVYNVSIPLFMNNFPCKVAHPLLAH